MNPTGKVPCLETDGGCIATSNAIARFVARCRADTSLYGNNFDEEGQIDTWMEFSTYELEIPLAVWLYPVLGLMEQPPAAACENAKKDVAKALKVLEDHLKSSPFLIGDSVSLADIVVVCVLKEAFIRLFDPAFRKPYAKVCAWFENCCSMPQFSSVFGSVKLCQQAEKPQPLKPAFKQQAAPAAKKAAPEAKKAAPASPKAKAAAATPAAAAPAAAGPNPEVEAQIKAVGDEIRELKTKLKAEGLSGSKINNHEDIKKLVDRLQGLKDKCGGAAPAAAAPKAKAAGSPKAAPAAAPAAGGDVDAQVTALGDEIRLLKEKLKGEGLKGKALNDHPEIKEKVAKLQELKK